MSTKGKNWASVLVASSFRALPTYGSEVTDTTRDLPLFLTYHNAVIVYVVSPPILEEGVESRRVPRLWYTSNAKNVCYTKRMLRRCHSVRPLNGETRSQGRGVSVC